MLSVRVIPCLLLKNQGLVKTIRFKDPTYVGDPRNAIKIFNDKEVDELIFLDISASLEKRSPNLKMLSEIASECFMPLGYGGGISTLNDINQLLSLGIEKIIINSKAGEDPQFIKEATSNFGSSTIVVSIDVKKNLFGKNQVYIKGGSINLKQDPVEYAKKVQELGAGEIMINSIDKDGSMTGYDVDLIKSISSVVEIPVIACGGAGKLEHFEEAVKTGHASAVAAGSMFVFHGKHKAVLISYPERKNLEKIFSIK